MINKPTVKILLKCRWLIFMDYFPNFMDHFLDFMDRFRNFYGSSFFFFWDHSMDCFCHFKGRFMKIWSFLLLNFNQTFPVRDPLLIVVVWRSTNIFFFLKILEIKNKLQRYSKDILGWNPCEKFWGIFSKEFPGKPLEELPE